VKEKKDLSREAKAMQLGLEQKIEAQDETITQNLDNLGRINSRVKKLMQKSVKVADTAYSLNRAHFCFQAWISRYRSIKRSLRKICTVAIRSAYKVSLIRVKETAHQEFKYNSIRGILIGAFKRYQRRGLKSLFLNWKAKSQKVTRGLYEEEIFLQ
jgi:hypothetical protein